MFGFQKLDVYRCAVTFLGLASALAERVPRGYGVARSLLERADLLLGRARLRTAWAV